ncbi:MAG: tetratricopeptide repeat protein [Pseudanabaena sp. RU_4_16]|nr:tetratricopeptide repeat protein [Pseudanabaena sp. RU_4_16]
MQEGRYEEALLSFDRVLKIKPDFYEAWRSRGNALRKLRRYAEALVSYDRAVEIKPNYAEAWSDRGVAFMPTQAFRRGDRFFRARCYAQSQVLSCLE